MAAFRVRIHDSTGERELAIPPLGLQVGADPDNDLVLNGEGVLGRHFRLSVEQETLMVHPHEPGLAVEGVPLDGPTPLRHGSILRVGTAIHLIVIAPPPAVAPDGEVSLMALLGLCCGLATLLSLPFLSGHVGFMRGGILGADRSGGSYFLIAPALAVICGHLARSQTKRSGEGGRTLALVGMVIGYGFLLSPLLLLLWMFVA